MIVDVDLYYYEGDAPGDDGTWCAQWAQRGSHVATEDWETDLGLLVSNVVFDLQLEGPLSLNWRFAQHGGDLSPVETERLAAGTGVRLPARL